MKQGAGKTTELIRMSAKLSGPNGVGPVYIVCLDLDRVDYVMGIARHLGLNIPQPITAREFIRAEYYSQGRHGIAGFLVDDVEAILQQLSPHVKVMGIATVATP
jgi:hypothetical protein